jgi:hypothetical protein
MARQPGLFDIDERLRRLSDIGDQLEAFAAVVDFEMFRPELVTALNYSDGTKGGRPPFDPVLMFKILVIQAQNNLSDDRAEFLINDRLSFMRFLELGLGDRVPDAKTIWAFRERLTRAGAIEALFARFDRAIRDAYRSSANEAFMERHGFRSQVHRRKPKGRPMPPHIRRGNASRSSVRAAIEHVFAHQKGPMALCIRTIGIARARVKIGLANLTYNIRRLAFHERTAKTG